ncbi:MAG: hypothetical protein VX208_05095 [SAR324 cluster bacterium]|nr:hypothetical protein [SAR324 cluster bacterium]
MSAFSPVVTLCFRGGFQDIQLKTILKNIDGSHVLFSIMGMIDRIGIKNTTGITLPFFLSQYEFK